MGKLDWLPLEGLHVKTLPFLNDLRTFKRKLEESNEFNFFKIMKDFGFSETLLKESDYIKEITRYRVAHNISWNPDSTIKDYIKMYKSVKKEGFKFVKRKPNPVKILDKPFISTRFGWDLEGKEIWDGAAICACLKVLGHTKVKGVMVYDPMPGTKKAPYFKKKYKINSENYCL